MTINKQEVDIFLMKILPLMDEAIKAGANPSSFLAALQIVINSGLREAKKANRLEEARFALEWANRDEPAL